MWRFVLKENIGRYQALLSTEPSAGRRAVLQNLLNEAVAELATLEELSTPELVRKDRALKVIADRSVDEAMALLHAQFGNLQVVAGTGEKLIIIAHRNFRPSFLHYFETVAEGDGTACARCLASGTEAAVEDIHADPLYAPHRQAAAEAGYRAVLSSPVPDGDGRIIAVISTHFADPRKFMSDEVERLNGHARSLGPMLEGHLQGRTRHSPGRPVPRVLRSPDSP